MAKKASSTERIEIPRSGGDLWAYFDNRERQDPSLYKGYGEMAAEAVEAVEDAHKPWVERSTYSEGIAVLPNRSADVYYKELTRPSKEFMELFFATYDLHPIIDETSKKDPYGRILWSSNGRSPVNVVESRRRDQKGDLFSLSVVAQVPEDIGQVYYPPETRRQIKETLEISRLSNLAMSAAREAQLDYWVLIDSLESTDFESPYDQAA